MYSIAIQLQWEAFAHVPVGQPLLVCDGSTDKSNPCRAFQQESDAIVNSYVYSSTRVLQRSSPFRQCCCLNDCMMF